MPCCVQPRAARTRRGPMRAGCSPSASCPSCNPRSAWRRPRPLTLQPREKRDVECRVGVGARVEGRVVDQFDKPVTHRSVRLEATTSQRQAYYFGPGVNGREQHTTTDDDGRFAFEDISAGTWVIGPAALREPGDEFAADGAAP